MLEVAAMHMVSVKCHGSVAPVIRPRYGADKCVTAVNIASLQINR